MTVQVNRPSSSPPSVQALSSTASVSASVMVTDSTAVVPSVTVGLAFVAA